MNSAFDPMCRRCPRLCKFLDAVRLDEPGYFCRPVPQFGDPDARLLIVGLAPGKHGANRTGRPFTGDYAGILLYATLHKFGLASGPVSTAADDALKLLNTRITNEAECYWPPTTAAATTPRRGGSRPRCLRLWSAGHVTSRSSRSRDDRRAKTSRREVARRVVAFGGGHTRACCGGALTGARGAGGVHARPPRSIPRERVRPKPARASGRLPGA